MERVKASLRDPNQSLTLEARKAGNQFLDAFDRWDKESSKHDFWTQIPTILMIPLLPFYLLWTWRWNKRCDHLYQDVVQSQNHYHDLRRAYAKS